MAEFVLKQRTLPMNDSYDVIVVGGGPSGCTAAAAAAREGAKTLLVESTGSLGGMGTSALVPAWCPFTDKEKILYRGLGEALLKSCIRQQPHVPDNHYDWVPIDPELLKRLYDEMVTTLGADILFMTSLAGVETDDAGGVEALLLSNKQGLCAYKADVYIDCTGDGDLAVWAGAEYEQGDEDGDLQPATHCFSIANVDMYAYYHALKIRGGGIKHGPGEYIIDKIVASGKYPLIPDNHACNSVIGPGVIGFNAGHLWDVDNTDPISISKAMVAGRKQAKAFRDAFAEFFPEAFANGYLVSTGALMGIRETRRVLCDYYLTTEDFKALKSFPDEICRNSYFIDVHHKEDECDLYNDGEKPGNADALKNLTVGRYNLNPGESHGIPYRCLTPKGLRNVLIAGRSISTDRAVQGSTRVMPVCLAMGEAAGIAAAHAHTTHDNDVHAVDTDKLRARLQEEGAYLPEVNT